MAGGQLRILYNGAIHIEGRDMRYEYQILGLRVYNFRSGKWSNSLRPLFTSAFNLGIYCALHSSFAISNWPMSGKFGYHT